MKPLGCGIDAYLSYVTCKLTRRELESRGIRTLIAPPFYWGINRTTHVFGGTFTVRKETMKALLHDILGSLKSHGFTTVINLNFHADGHHCSTLLESMREARQTLEMDTYCVYSRTRAGRFNLSGEEDHVLLYEEPQAREPLTQDLDIHAGANETSLVAAFFPEQVNEEIARRQKPTNLTSADMPAWRQDARRTTPGGYFGSPANYVAAGTGEDYEQRCRNIADAIEERLGGK
ncbi:creatininase family protein [Candidatus Latescibacterota bacterium]